MRIPRSAVHAWLAIGSASLGLPCESAAQAAGGTGAPFMQFVAVPAGT